ncbi:MAG: MFS transporter [Planctomycetales bacterium]|nr:MFS transporter [Planctomycetales bacterium]
MKPTTTIDSRDATSPVHESATGSRATLVRYLVLAWLCAAAAIAYASRSSIAVAESTMREQLDLTKDQMGQIMSVFFFAYAFGQVPLSWFGTSLGSRRSLTLFASLWSAATVAMSFAFGMPLLIVSRLANGLAQAGLFPCCTMSLADWFPANRRAFASGCLGSSMSVGSVLGTAIGGVLVVHWGWRGMFAATAALGVVWAVGFYAWFRNRPEEHAWVNEAERKLIVEGRDTHANQDADEPTITAESAAASDEPLSGLGLWLPLLTSPATWWICGQQFCRAAGQAFFVSWFATYLQETRQISIETSGALNMLPQLALVAGSLLGGTVSDAILQLTGSLRLARQGVASAAMIGCALCVFLALWVEQPWLAVALISVGTFGAAVGGPCAYSITIDMGGRHVASLFAVMNMVGNLGASAFILLTPKLLAAADDYGLDTNSSWNAVLVAFSLLYVGAAICWLLLRPRGTVFQQALLGRPAT